MTDKETQELREYTFRARIPQMARYAAAGVAGLTVLVLIIAFYTNRHSSVFKFKPEHTQLSTEVVAEVNGYERTESDGDVPKYYIKADRAKTFSDNHQELENAYVRVYSDDGQTSDDIKADKAVYVPEENKNFTAYLAGSVTIDTRDRLKVRSDSLTYTKATQLAETDDKIDFERDNVRGSGVGARVRIGDKRLDLLNNVEVETFESPEKELANVRYAKLTSASASYDQAAERIEMNDGFTADIDSAGRTTKANAGSAVAMLSSGGDQASRQLKQIELIDTVHIVSNDGTTPATIDAGYCLYDKDADRFELKNGVHIVSVQGGQQTEVRSTNAVYQRTALHITLDGAAQVAQGPDYVKGDSMEVDLFPGQKIKAAVVKGSTFLKQTSPERLTQVSASEMRIVYDKPDQLREAHAIGDARAELIPQAAADYSKVTMIAPRSIDLAFKGAGLLEKMKTDGRTTIQLDVPDTAADASNKRVTADSVNTFFADSGKDIRRAEAVGNAELYIEPHKASVDNFRTTINAPRFDCEFFPTGNNARSCVGGVNTKTVRVPTVASNEHGTQTMTATRLTADFDQTTKDISRLEASGDAKFNELSRNGIASSFIYTESDRVLRLRGGSPTVWDSASRAKAGEIDWNTVSRHASLRGDVSTTFYNGKAMGGSPFANAEKPVFVTAASAELDDATQVAIYTGNARGWQDDNYVRADRLTVEQAFGRLIGEGSVQSGLFDAKVKRGDKESKVPVFASARSMVYEKGTRTISYREDVDIRQGTDRITSGSADVLLSPANEVEKTIAEKSVVITQPGRKATGNWVQYTAGDEVAILRGDPAVVTDAENGGTQGAQITVYMRENRFVGDGRGRQNPNARVKSVYKTKSDQ